MASLVSLDSIGPAIQNPFELQAPADRLSIGSAAITNLSDHVTQSALQVAAECSRLEKPCKFFRHFAAYAVSDP